ncbi:MAG TPA: PKD domain-containing protein [Planctomycetota bacterium]|nr:PKD domain-containing protein [Planctomycetota bacterium]
MSHRVATPIALCAVVILVAAAQLHAADGPVIHAVSPGIVATTGGDTIKITGQNFYRETKVFIGGVDTDVTFRSSGRLEVRTNLHAPGAVDILVVNPDAQMIKLQAGLVYAPGVEFQTTASSGSEGTTSVALTVTLSEVNTVDVTVDLLPIELANEATANSDFSNAAVTVTIPAGQLTASGNITIVDDSVAELSEDLDIRLKNPVNGVLGSSTIHTYTILDNETPVVSIDPGGSVIEGNFRSFLLSRKGDISAPVTVNFTVAGTATETTDYGAIGTTTNFAAFSTFAFISISTILDATVEPNETIDITLAAGAYTIGTPASSSMTIRDVDSPPANDNFASAQVLTGLPVNAVAGTNLGATVEAGEPAGTATVWYDWTSTINGGIAIPLSSNAFLSVDVYTGAAVNALSQVFSQSFNVSYSKSPVIGFPVTNGQVYHIRVRGSFTQQDAFTLSLRDVTVAPPSSGPTNGVPGTLPLVNAIATTHHAYEQGSVPGAVTLFRSGDTTSPLTVWFDLSGTAVVSDGDPSNGPEDFTLTNATFDVTHDLFSAIIPAGANSVAVGIVPVDDQISEGNYDNPYENVFVYLQNDPTTGTPTYDLSVLYSNSNVHIFDNDLEPLIYSPESTNGMLNAPFSYQLTLLGSNTSGSATGLPPGLTMSATGLISGTPTQEGLFTAVITAQSSGGSAIHKLSILIIPELFITTFAGKGAAAPLGTFAGDEGPGTAASLSAPTGVAVDAAGNILFSDMGNNRVRRINVTTGIVITVAGNGLRGFTGDGVTATSTSLDFPGGLAVDANGNLFICDVNNHRVRRVDAVTGMITTVAGSGGTYTNEGSFAGDGGPATAARLNFPCGVAVDAAGNLYIADTGNGVVRRVDAATGKIQTIAGNINRGFDFLDPFYSTSAINLDGPALNVRLKHPIAVAVDSAGHVYIAEQKSHKVRKLIPSTNVLTTIAGFDADNESNGPEYAKGIRGFFGDGNFAALSALNQPCGVAVDGTGNVYITEIGNNRIRKVDALTGRISSISGSGPSDQLNTLEQAYAHYYGDLVVDDSGIHNIPGLVPPSFPAYSGFSGDGGRSFGATLSVPTGVAVDAAGRVYFADTANLRIRQIAPAGAAPANVAFTATPNPAQVDSAIAFVATATDADSPSLLYKWDFGDGSAGSGMTFSKKYAAAGTYTATLTVTDGATAVTSSQVITIVAPASGGGGNLSDGKTVENPVDEISITVTKSGGGVVEVTITVADISRAVSDYNIETSFDGVNGQVGKAAGNKAVQKFTEPGVYVASSTITEKASNTVKGLARKTITISAREIGQGTLAASNPTIQTPAVKGKFVFTGTKSDTVAFSGTVALPKGFDIGAPSQSISISVGNVIDTINFDSKGKPSLPTKLGNVTKFKITYPKLKTGGTITQDDTSVAKIALTLAKPDLDNKGFAADGITAKRGRNDTGLSSTRKLQAAIVLNGVAYETIIPVEFKLSTKGDSGAIGLSKAR